MEQIQFNGAAKTAAVTLVIGGEAGKKSDLFPKMLKERGAFAGVLENNGKRSYGRGDNGNGAAEAEEAGNLVESGESPGFFPVRDWLWPVNRGVFPESLGGELNLPGTAEGNMATLATLESVETLESVATPPGQGKAGVAAATVTGNAFAVADGTFDLGGLRGGTYAGQPLAATAASFSLSDLAALPQRAETTRISSFAQTPFFGPGQQTADAMLAKLPGGTPAAALNTDLAGVYAMAARGTPGEQPPPTALPTVSPLGQTGGEAGTAPTVLAATSPWSAQQPKQQSSGQRESLAPSQFEALASAAPGHKSAGSIRGQAAAGDEGTAGQFTTAVSKALGQSQTAGDSKARSQGQAAPEVIPRQPQSNFGNTVSTKAQTDFGGTVMAEPSTAETGEVREGRQSAEYAPLQNTPGGEITGESQVKPANQAQSAVRHRLTQEINAHFHKGSNSFELQLYPKDLGKVSVKMTMEHSTLILEISAASAKTQSIILANADDIRAMLQSQLQQDVQISLTQEQKAAQQQLYKDERQGQHNPHAGEEQQTEENEERQELDTEGFLTTLKTLSEKHFRERSQDYAD